MTDPMSGKDQIASLLETLTNDPTARQAFEHLRGKLGSEDPLDLFQIVIKATSSSINFCELWDTFAADARVMGQLLTRLQKDGWTVAEKTLRNTLRNPGWKIPGEQIAETRFITVLVPDFPRALAIAQWIKAEKPENIAALFELFPELAEYVSRRNGYDGWELIRVYENTALYHLDLKPLKQAGGRPMQIWSKGRFLDDNRGLNDLLSLGGDFGPIIGCIVEKKTTRNHQAASQKRTSRCRFVANQNSIRLGQ